MYQLTILLLFLALGVLIISLMKSSEHSSFIAKRLSKVVVDEHKKTKEEENLSPLTEVMSNAVNGLVGKFVPENITTAISKKIALAKIKDFDLSKYFLFKALALGFALVILPIYLAMMGMKVNLGLIAVVSVIGFMLPDAQLKSAIEKRHKVIFKELPRFIDLLRICVEAGMDMEGGLTKIVDNFEGELREETAQAVAEIQLGKTIGEALERMSDRIDLPDFSSFITMIQQATEMGISVATVLKNQSYQINLKYVQDSRAKASKIPVLILMPMVFFIFPALLCVILGPAIIMVSTSF
jgi:tight adherence protein C